MRFFLLVVSFLTVCTNLFAQLGNETYDEEEKDRVARGDNAINAQRESLWSLSNSNLEWKAPVQIEGRWEAVSLPSRKMNFSGKIKSQPQKKGQQDQHNKWVDNRNQQIEAANAAAEEARRREEERKRLLAEQNKRDRERGAMEYYARMASFHQANAARDRWVASEGLRQLKEDYHAIDMAQIPQSPVTPKMEGMSGKDMAEFLKSQEDNTSEGNITVIFVDRDETRENKRNATIQQDDKYIDLFDDGGYDQDEAIQWDMAVVSECPIVQPPLNQQKAQEHSATLLAENGLLNLDNFKITTLPNIGCIALMGDSILLLDNDSLPFLKWSVESDVSQVIACGDKTFGKQDFRIVEITDDGLSVVCELESDDFCIYPETDSTFILCASILDLSIVTRVHINGLTYDELLRIPSDIRKIVSNGTVTLAMLEDRIIDISQSPTLFYCSTTKLNDVCMCKEGLLVATDETVLLLKSPTEVLTFVEEGVSRLWCDGPDIYVINKTGDLIRYSNN